MLRFRRTVDTQISYLGINVDNRLAMFEQYICGSCKGIEAYEDAPPTLFHTSRLHSNT